MKNKTFWILLAIMGGGIGIRFILGLSFALKATDWIGFPFEQIGTGLRELSLKGGGWNILAIIIYFLLCAWPLAILIWKAVKKERQVEDILLILLSLGLFYTLYMMINPGFLPAAGKNYGGEIGKYLLCVILHSMIVAYLVIVMVRRFYSSRTEKLYRYMEFLLVGCIVVFAFSIAVTGYDEMLLRARTIAEKNQGTADSLQLTYLFVGLKYIVDSIPKVVGIWISFTAMGLLAEMRADSYSLATITEAEQLARSCKIGLIAMVCSNMIFNGMQMMFVKQLRDISGYVEVPLLWILFALGAMILSRMCVRNKQLKEENDSII